MFVDLFGEIKTILLQYFEMQICATKSNGKMAKIEWKNTFKVKKNIHIFKLIFEKGKKASKAFFVFFMVYLCVKFNSHGTSLHRVCPQTKKISFFY